MKTKSAFDWTCSRRQILGIAGGGALAITFMPRIAFAAAAKLKSLRTGNQAGGKTRLVIETSARPSYTTRHMTSPDRFVIEIANTQGAAAVKPALADGTIIKNVRQNQLGTKLQIVADLTRPIAEIPKNQIMLLNPGGGNQYRLVFDMTAKAGGKITAAPLPETRPAQTHTTANNNTAAARKAVIVIDAGHGGKDPGAIGVTGIREKDVVLSVAKKLRNELVLAGFTVHLTRDRDIFLNLDTRAGIAEQRHADLFMSLHANANPSRDTRGFSVYTLSKKASDEEAQKLADAENAADKIEVDGFAKFEPNIRNALSALQQHSVAEASMDFAAGTSASFKRAGIPPMKNADMRSAPFAVLRSTIPSALIELGHLSNRAEEKLLNTAAHQNKLVAAITAAVKGYDFEV